MLNTNTTDAQTPTTPEVNEIPVLNALFPMSLRLLKMHYALSIFGYIRRRGDTDMEHEGLIVQRFMQQFRSAVPQNMALYYDNLRPIMNLLYKYPEVEENAAVSSFYEAQRGQLLLNLRSSLREMEAQSDLMDYLELMLHEVVVGKEDLKADGADEQIEVDS